MSYTDHACSGTLVVEALVVDGVPVTGGGGGGGVTLQQVLDEIAAHAALADPHAGYALESALGTAALADVGAFDAVGAAEAWIATHVGLSDPHAQYALESSLAAIATSGSASDLSAGTVAIARIPTGSSSSTVCIGNDGRLSDARTPLSHTHVATAISDSTAAGRAVLTAADAAAQRTAIGCPGSSGSGPSSVKKTSDQTFNSATPADVSALVFALTAGRYYKFEFLLSVRSDTLTVGVAASLTFPAMTRFAARVLAPFAADGAGAEWQGEITASDDAVVPTAIAAINTDYLLKIEGIALPSASGNLQVRARTETGTTVVTVRQGSMGLLYDLGT